MLPLIRGAGEDVREASDVMRYLRGVHAGEVMDLPGPPLDYHGEAALWGAVRLFHAACMICFRDTGSAEVERLMTPAAMPDAENPAAVFSADLCLRYWPDLHRMARTLSEDDVLVTCMRRMAETFPFSTAGMGLRLDTAHVVMRHPGLRQMYAERLLERGDADGLSAPGLRDLILSKLGLHRDVHGAGLLTLTPDP